MKGANSRAFPEFHLPDDEVCRLFLQRAVREPYSYDRIDAVRLFSYPAFVEELRRFCDERTAVIVPNLFLLVTNVFVDSGPIFEVVLARPVSFARGLLPWFRLDRRFA